MSKKDFVIGLDIGTTKVCCIVGEVVPSSPGSHEPAIDVIAIGSAPSNGIRKGVVINIESTVEAIRTAVKDAEIRAGIKIQSATIGIAGTHIQSFNSSGVVAIKDKEIQQGDVSRVLEAARAIMIPQDRQILHVIPQEFIIDDQDGIRDPIGMSGVRLEAKVHIVTGALASIQNLSKCVNRAGLSVAGICLQPVASSEAVLNDDEKELGVALVDIGGGTTDIAIFRHGALLHTSVIPVGGVHITNDISVGLRTPYHEAERIKIDHGCAMTGLVKEDASIDVPAVGENKPRSVSQKILAQIVEARVEELFNLIQAEIHKSGHSDFLSAGIVLTGGTTLLRGMTELGDFLFEVPLKRGVPVRLGGLKEVVNSPKYSTAVGLLKYAASHSIRGGASPLRTGNGLLESISGGVKNIMKDLF